MNLEDLNFDLKDDRKRMFDLIQQYFQRVNIFALKRISGSILDIGVAKNDKNLVYVSYLPYILNKILTQPHIVKNSSWVFSSELILEYIERIENSDVDKYIILISEFENIFKNKNHELYRYIKNILRKAKVKQAAKIHSMGISSQKARSLTDADTVELNNYLSEISERDNLAYEEKISEKVGFLEKLYEVLK